MKNSSAPPFSKQQPMIYQIRIKGHVSSQWTDWFEGLTITLEDEGYTLLTGPITDDAALYGILKRVRDLGMQLVSVNRVEPDSEKRYEVEANSSANGRNLSTKYEKEQE